MLGNLAPGDADTIEFSLWEPPSTHLTQSETGNLWVLLEKILPDKGERTQSLCIYDDIFSNFDI